MRIVINCRFLTQKISGVQRFALEMCNHMHLQEDDILFVCPNQELHIKPKFKIQKIGINKGHLWEQIDLPFYLKRNKSPLLINFTGVGPVLYKNKLTTIHDVSYLYNPKWFSKKYVMYYTLMTKLSIKNSLKIITVSEFSKNEIIQSLKVNENKIIIINNAVDWKIERQNKKEKYILAVSSIDPRKNFINLMKAFQRLDLFDYKLLIVGAKNDLFKGEKLNLNHSNVVYMGYVSDTILKELYRKASIFVYVSLYEGFGIPPLEAMAMGCPTVVSNVASIPEVCKDASYYVKPLDIESVSSGIIEVLKNTSLQNKMISRGYDVVKSYSWEKSSEKLLKEIELL